METSSKTCVAVDTEQATLFVALELSQSTWLVGLHSPIADKISINRIDGGDTDKLLALIEKKREQAARQLGRPVRVVSCYEAGRDGFWLHRSGTASTTAFSTRRRSWSTGGRDVQRPIGLMLQRYSGC